MSDDNAALTIFTPHRRRSSQLARWLPALMVLGMAPVPASAQFVVNGVPTNQTSIDVFVTPTTFNDLYGRGTLRFTGGQLEIRNGSGNLLSPQIVNSGECLGGGGGTYFGSHCGLTVGGGTVTLGDRPFINFEGSLQVDGGATVVASDRLSRLTSRFMDVNGTFDVSRIDSPSFYVSSLEDSLGPGSVYIGNKQLIIINQGNSGSDPRGGVFDGVIQDGGLGGGTGGGIRLLLDVFKLAGVNTYTGPTIVDAGATLELVEGGDIAASSVVNVAGTFSIAGITGPVDPWTGLPTTRTSATVQNIAGSGTIDLGAKRLIIANGSGSFDGTITSPCAGTTFDCGNLEKQGSGTLALTGTNTYTGATDVNAGTLVVNGSIASSRLTTVASAATLAGTGTVGSTTVDGGILAPGSPNTTIGTLNVAGNLALINGAIYRIEIGQPGQADRVDVSGTATIGDAGVNIGNPSPAFIPGASYRIMTAAGGVFGRFNNPDQRLPLVTLGLTYDANNVYFNVTRNATPIAVIATTPTQVATATGLQTLPVTNPVQVAVVLQQTTAGIQQALDALSGQSHASIKAPLIEDSRFVREAINNRLLGAGSRSLPVPAAYAVDRAVVDQPRGTGFALWGQGFGSWDKRDRSGNDVPLERNIGGFFLGADAAIMGDVTLGIAGGYSQSDYKIPGRQASAESDNYTAALYAGTNLSGFSLRGGLAYTWHEINLDRRVVFPGFSGALSSSYDAGTAQAFGEASYRLTYGGTMIEPFAGLAGVYFERDRFTEIGGPAALHASSEEDTVAFTTLGLRAATQFGLGSGMVATAYGTLGWRHAFGDVAKDATFTFGGAGLPFTVAGLPIARDAAVIEAGLAVAITQQASLGIAYNGQLSNKAQDNGVKANLLVKF